MLILSLYEIHTLIKQWVLLSLPSSYFPVAPPHIIMLLNQEFYYRQLHATIFILNSFILEIE